MVENITLGVISASILFLAALIGGIKYLKSVLKDSLTELFKDQFEAINTKLDGMDEKIDRVDMQSCKNFLVRFLADVERGDLTHLSEIQRFWEEYEHYLNEGGNSYIKEWVEKLKKEGKL